MISKIPDRAVSFEMKDTSVLNNDAIQKKCDCLSGQECRANDRHVTLSRYFSSDKLHCPTSTFLFCSGISFVSNIWLGLVAQAGR
jgi:hypothetical protein